jgi:hypothetical protein
MEDSKRDEGTEKKKKYVKPELISLDKEEGTEGAIFCSNGSADLYSCTVGGAVPPT